MSTPPSPPPPPAPLGAGGGAPVASAGLPATVPPRLPQPPSTAPSTGSTWGLSWSGPGRSAPPAVLAGALVTAIVAAVTMSWSNFGIGWFVTAVVGAVAATIAAWAVRRQRAAAPPTTPAAPQAAASAPSATSSAPAAPPAPPAPAAPGGRRWPQSVFWGVVAVALTGVSTVRAAPWLWALCLPTAVLCGTFALAGVRSLRGMFLGFFTFPAAVLRALPWAGRGLSSARGRSGSSLGRVLVSVLVTLVLLLIFGSLLANADAAFGRILGDIVPAVTVGTVFGGVFSFLLLGFGTIGAAYLAGAQPTLDGGLGGTGRLRPVEWGIPVGALVLLFGGFVGVQATYLFGGRDVVLRTADLTAAEYARGGFAQLVVVTVLTLIVIGVAALVASRETAGHRLAMRVLLGLLAVLTLTIVASALSRMWAYDQAFGATRLRLVVAVFELWLGVVFLLILVAGAIRLTRRSTWVPAAAAGAAALALLGLAVLNPDRFIADRNIDRYLTGDRHLDLFYLWELSADAVPAIERLDGNLGNCALRGVWSDATGAYYTSDSVAEVRDPDPWREWNLGRARGRAAVEDYQPVAYDACFRLATALDPTTERR